MLQRIAHITLLVDDYDDAIRFYVDKLNFQLIEDTALSESKRWVLLATAGDAGCRLLIAKASTPEQRLCVGNQTGGRVFLFLHTDDFWRDYHSMISHNIQFVKEPSKESYGMVAVFKDLYGNLLDLIEPIA